MRILMVAVEIMYEYASKSYKIAGVSTVDIMDMVDLVCLYVFNLWFSSLK